MVFAFSPLHAQSVGGLCVLLLLCVIPQAKSSNFFSFTYAPSSVWNNEGWGEICYDLTVYTPSCGWQVILTSSEVLNSISVWDSTVTKLDDYTFIMENMNYNGDYQTTPPTSCGSITIYGQFGNTEPNIYATWYCVCNATTSGSCQSVPYVSVAPGASTTLQTTAAILASTPDTTVTIPDTSTDAAVTTVTSNPSHTLYPGQLETSPSQVYLHKQGTDCYIGVKLTVLTNVRHLLQCCSTCLTLPECAGVNFWQSSNRCDLVEENSDVNPSLTGPVSGCEYWKIMWKS